MSVLGTRISRWTDNDGKIDYLDKWASRLIKVGLQTDKRKKKEGKELEGFSVCEYDRSKY